MSGSPWDIFDELADIMRAREQPWRQHAACRGMGTETFFVQSQRGRPANDQDGRDVLAAARAVCQRCPVVDACRAEVVAMPRRQAEHGCWAGTSPKQRRGLRARAKLEAQPPPEPKKAKWCPDCACLRPTAAFAPTPSRADGLAPYCRRHAAAREAEARARRRGAA